MDNREFVNVRRYRETSDVEQVEALERRCEAGPAGSSSLFCDFLGDPLCRVRHLPYYSMLVSQSVTAYLSHFPCLRFSLLQCFFLIVFLKRMSGVLLCYSGVKSHWATECLSVCLSACELNCSCSAFQQVAEVGGRIVGVIRGGVKDVVCRQSALLRTEKAEIRIPLYARVGYLLGLRVCPLHRLVKILLRTIHEAS